VKSRKLGFFGKRRENRRSTKPQSKSVLRKGLVETLEKRELLNADWNPALVGDTGLFANAASRDAVLSYINAKSAGGVSSGGLGGPEGGPNDIISVVEAEPNNSQPTAQLVPLAGNLGVNIIGINSTSISGPPDIDWYSFDLLAGDILDARLTSNGGIVTNIPLLSIYDASRRELVSSISIPRSMPAVSPLTQQSVLTGPVAGQVAAHAVVPTAGRYFVRASDISSGYTLQLRRYRPTIEAEPAGTKQILYLDFEGGIIARSLFGLGPGSGRLSPMRNSMAAFGLNQADEAQFIDEIVERVKAKFDQLGIDTTNPNYGIEIRNSKDDPDPWGLPNVSRIIVGGTWQELISDPTAPSSGILGIAQSIDPGNFDRQEQAIVMQDVFIAGQNVVGTASSSTKLELIAELQAVVIAHEAGHFLGGWHQNPFNNTNVVMDQFYFEPVTSGAGIDGVFGTPDDRPIVFGGDGFSFGGGVFEFGGFNDTVSWLGWGLGQGLAGGTITGKTFTDVNVSRSLDLPDRPLAGVTVFSDLNGDGLFSTGEFSTVSDANGDYRLLVPAGNHTIRQVTPAGFRLTTPTSNAIAVTVGLNQTVTNRNFGSEALNQNFTGVKWSDANGNGLRDPGEPGIAGVWIYIDLDGDNRIDLGEPSTRSAADGTYKLNFPGAGTYQIREVVDPGYIQTFPGITNNGDPLDDYEHQVVLTGNPVTDALAAAGLNFGNRLTVDFGDAPASYGVASHGFVDGLTLGTAWDSEQSSQFSAAADGDDINGSIGAGGVTVDDEDGVLLSRPLVAGSSNNRFSITATNTTGVTSYLQGWIDFNRDGDFADAGEKIISNLALGSGTTDVSFAAPATAVLGDTFVRLRYSTEQNLTATGATGSGEVEDYRMTVVATLELAVDDRFSVSRNSVINSLDVLGNDFRLPGEVLEIVSVSATTAGGIVQVSSDNRILYTPPNSFVGQDVFTYTMLNSGGEQDTATVVVDVNLFFQDPIAIDDSFDIPTNAIDFPLNVLANDIEGQGGSLSIVSVTQPDKGGQISIATGGKSLRYTPPRGLGDTEFFTYTVSDANGNQSAARVTLHTLPGDQTDDDVLIRLVATDLAGTPITAVQQGQEFKIDVYVDDLRFSTGNTGVAAGVFAAYTDLLYNLQLVSTVAGPPGERFDFDVDFFNDFTVFQTGNATVPGIIDEFGATIDRQSINNPDPVRMASITFSARSPGIARFLADPSDVKPEGDTLLFDTPGNAVPIEKIRYQGTSIEIVGDGVEFPIAVDDSVPQAIPAGTVRFPINVLTNDRPGSTGVVSIFSSSDGLNGTTLIDTRGTSNPADDRILYTPNGGFNGADQFTYTIQDARGIQSTATVTVRVGAADDNDIVALRLSATDLNGQPIDQIAVGSQFQLRGYVDDLRVAGADLGIFAAYEDVLYSANLVSPVVSTTNDPNLGFQIQFGPNYQRVREGDIRTPGVINEVGAVSTGDSALGVDEQLLFIITMTANAVGQASFIGDPADISPLHDTLTYEPVSPVSFDRIRYGFDTLNITSANGNGGNGEFTNWRNPLDVNNDGSVSPIDVLSVINDLNKSGSRALGGGGGEGEGDRLYIDTNADGFVSASDVLGVINWLNSNSSSGEGEFSLDAMMSVPAIESTVDANVERQSVSVAEFAIPRSTIGVRDTGRIYGPSTIATVTDSVFGEADDDMDALLSELAPEIEETWKKDLLA
jgi:large repetitive protein